VQSVVAYTYSLLNVLLKDNFVKVIGSNPDLIHRLTASARNMTNGPLDVPAI
jgi:hypothetical protein